MKEIQIEDIQEKLNFFVDERICEKIKNKKLLYEYITDSEFIDYINNYLTILNSDLTYAGQHRKTQWENGWNENLNFFKKNNDIDSIIPIYHKKNNIARFNNKIIKTFTKNFDYELHSFFVDSILLNYIKNFDNIYEFGCGTGYHLFRLNEYEPNKTYTGLDWCVSSQQIIKEYSEKIKTTNITGFNFDYYNPDYSLEIENSLIYTIASLEQIGENYNEFLNFILKKKPSLCIHFEPISEVLDPNNILDYLTIKYFEKRKYLKNFFTTLKKLQELNKIEIIDSRRLYYGSKFIEGHTLIIWKPV